MRAVDIILKKRDGDELSRQEIAFLIQGYCSGSIPDYQMAAFLMAVFFRGMTEGETTGLTDEMCRSGSVLNLADIPGRKVDKHSTGGVGDKTSLVIAPVLAAAGLVVPMISGRALGHTGGTLDKLESIPGLDVRLTPERFKDALRMTGASIIGQTEDLVPADRKLYALRDVTATIGSHPLIAASIMSKKLAEGIDGLVLDIKTGSGAFMRRPKEAEQLGRLMISLGRAFGRKVTAVITDMNQPLGNLVGNSLEVIESIEVLKGEGPEDVVALCRELSAHCLVVGEAAGDLAGGREVFESMISSGKALAKFRDIVAAQGGDASVADDLSRLPRAAYRADVPSPVNGFVASMDTRLMGIAMCTLGAGRETIDSRIDHAVGMRLFRKTGDPVRAGETLCELHYNDDSRLEQARSQVLQAYRFSQERPRRLQLVKKVL